MASSPVLLMKQQPFKMQVKLLTLRSLDGPHTELAAIGVSRVTGGEDSADGGVVHRSSTRGWVQRVRCEVVRVELGTQGRGLLSCQPLPHLDSSALVLCAAAGRALI